MTLREAVERYVAWQRDHGAKFRSSAETLDTFCRRIGEDRDCDTVGEDEIRRFLAGTGVLTRTRSVKYGTACRVLQLRTESGPCELHSHAAARGRAAAAGGRAAFHLHP